MYFYETGTGPLKAIRSLAAYLKREQRLGRVSLRVSPDHTARVILGACFAESFLVEFLGPERAGPSDEEFARAVVKSMKDALQPKKPALR